MEKLPIPVPPLEIQRQIVKRLDLAFSKIANGTKHLQSAKDNLTKYKQSLLKSAFDGTLTQDCPLSQGESTAESSLRGESKTNTPTTPSLRDSGEATTKQSTKKGTKSAYIVIARFRTKAWNRGNPHAYHPVIARIAKAIRGNPKKTIKEHNAKFCIYFV